MDKVNKGGRPSKLDMITEEKLEVIKKLASDGNTVFTQSNLVKYAATLLRSESSSAICTSTSFTFDKTSMAFLEYSANFTIIITIQIKIKNEKIIIRSILR